MMVWQDVSSNSMGSLHVIEGTMSSAMYLSILVANFGISLV